MTTIHRHEARHIASSATRAPPAALDVLRADMGPLQSDNIADADTKATAMKVCRLLRNPLQGEEHAASLAVEDEDADPVGPAPSEIDYRSKRCRPLCTEPLPAHTANTPIHP